MDLVLSAHTSEGNRPENQDFYIADPKNGVFIVADGMGGHAGGQIASKEAATTVFQSVTNAIESGAFSDPDQIATTLVSGVGAACAHVYRKGNENVEFQGMGTTLTALVVKGTSAVLAHVGDSRLYLLRDKGVFQLSTDHTYVQELVRQKAISPEEAKDHPYSHVLIRAVGTTESVPVDILKFEVVADDTLLLCSDGFYSLWEHSEGSLLAAIDAFQTSHKVPFESLAEKLVQHTVAEDGSDNTTAVMIRCNEPSGDSAVLERRTDVNLELELIQSLGMFQHLKFADVLKVMSIVEVFDVEANTAIVQQGDLGDALYIVVNGSFSVTKDDTELATLSRGEHFGDIALLFDSARIATVTSKERSRVLRVTREPLMRLLSEYPRLGAKFYEQIAITMARRLDNTNARLAQLGG